MGLLTFSDLEIMPLDSDSAVVLGHWKLKRTQDRPHGRFTLIFRKTADGWRIVHDHTSAAAPPQYFVTNLTRLNRSERGSLFNVLRSLILVTSSAATCAY